MKIFLTGGNGQLAYDLKRQMHVRAIDYSAPTRQELDITNREQVLAALKYTKPAVVVNTAAYTLVDKAEQDAESAFAVNQVGAKNLAQACDELSIPLIHVSTDYVFDGKKQKPYLETDAVQPLSIYGESKWRGEQEVQQYCEKHIILRVSGVFGVHGNNFVKTILRLGKERDELRIVADQTICPTPASDIADLILTQSSHLQWGLYHYCSEGQVSWYNFANAIFAEAQQYTKFAVKKIHAISTAEYPTAAQRPAYSVLACEKVTSTFNFKPIHWQKGLVNVIQSIYTA